MKKIFFIFVLLTSVSGCAQKEIVIGEIQEDVSSDDASSEVVAIDAVELEAAAENAAAEPLVITERFVDWGFASANRKNADIDTVIIHSVYNPFDREDRHDLGEIISIFEGYGVAPHYIITRDGQVHYIVQEKDIAYHAGRSRTPDGRTGINDFSIGIEMIGSLEDDYTSSQYDSLRSLLEQLGHRYSLKYVLGHDEIAVEDPWNFDWSSINDLRHEER